jgi:hypothetical protein
MVLATYNLRKFTLKYPIFQLLLTYKLVTSVKYLKHRRQQRQTNDNLATVVTAETLLLILRGLCRRPTFFILAQF